MKIIVPKHATIIVENINKTKVNGIKKQINGQSKIQLPEPNLIYLLLVEISISLFKKILLSSEL